MTQYRNADGSLSELSVQGPKLQYNVPILNGGTVSQAGTITVPGTIGATGTFTSTVIPTSGMDHIAVSATMDQAGTLSLQRYFDLTGTVTTGSAVTAAMSANTAALIDNVGTVIAQSAKVSIINKGTVAATPTAVAMVITP